MSGETTGLPLITESQPAGPKHFTDLTHREKMEIKKARRDRWTELVPIARARQGMTVRGNFSDHPKGQPRTAAPKSKGRTA